MTQTASITGSLKKVFALLRSRQVLVTVAVVIAALAIWWIGPLLGFGKFEPLAGVHVRVCVIAVLLAGWVLWRVRWSLRIAAVMFFCVLLWFATPDITVGRSQPLASSASRIGAIAVVLLAFAVHMTYRQWRRTQSDRRILQRVLRLGRRGERPIAAERLAEIKRIATIAIAQLKARRIGRWEIALLFQPRRYLYTLPWYIVLGSQGAGKTSVLRQASLTFPLDERIQSILAPAGRDAMPGWWVTNDAVLIDTAGYYSRHGTSRYPLPASSIQSDARESLAQRGNRRALTDMTEWQGFLGMLVKLRPGMPINGVVLTVDVAVLAHADPQVRIAEGDALRARLAEVHKTLGIEFPIWLIVTKIDRLTGFAEYVRALPDEVRNCGWGFALPDGHDAQSSAKLRTHCESKLTQLVDSLADHIHTRLLDETNPAYCGRLATLPEALTALIKPLTELVMGIFGETIDDAPAGRTMLRGVWLTSAMQAGNTISVERHTVLQRMVGAARVASPQTKLTGCGSYFLHDVLSRIVSEAHLVQPNRHWENRRRLQRLIGHALVWLVSAALAAGIWGSIGQSRQNLIALGQRAQTLTDRLTRLDPASSSMQVLPDVLSAAQELLISTSLDRLNPGNVFRFGLGMSLEIRADSRLTYDTLVDRLLLPQVVRRMEAAMTQALVRRDQKAGYDALRVYLMLYDDKRYNAHDVKAWVLDDWAHADSAAALGGRVLMLPHIQQLFSGSRSIQPTVIRNEGLIRQLRAFLDGSNVADRLYARAKGMVGKDAPDDVTLLSVIGPAAGTEFTRASGKPLSSGAPGLFTFDGYHNLFDKRLPEFVQAAREDDAWVMGQSSRNVDRHSVTGKLADADDPLTQAIRRQYLLEYAQQWDDFLKDIRIVGGTSLSFDLQILRRFAAPDSPLTRLARAAVRETTLTESTTESEQSQMQKVANRIGQTVDTMLGRRASAPLERELVDNHFAALREVVTGDAFVQAGTALVGRNDKTGLDGMAELLGAWYSALTVADNALANNSLPPESDTASKLKMMAGTMPAPFRSVLLQLATNGSREISEGIGQLLSRQMQAEIGDVCRLTIGGYYPFNPDSDRDVSLADFTRMFGPGGILDNFFTRTLAPFVDTSAKPWRYRTLSGATEPVYGPDLEPFEHTQAIREIFFNDPGGKQFGWKADIRIPELDPTIMSLALDIDGQALLYRHGPVTPLAVKWPGSRGGVSAGIAASPAIHGDASTIREEGPWALLRLLRKGNVVPTATLGRTRVSFDFDGRKAVLDITSAGSVKNPLTSDVLPRFRCPSSMPVFGLSDSGPPPGLPPGTLSTAPTSAFH